MKKIEALKKKAKKSYLKYCNIADTYSCGASMAEYMNQELRDIKLDFNNTLDELSKIDKDCPKDRL